MCGGIYPLSYNPVHGELLADLDGLCKTVHNIKPTSLQQTAVSKRTLVHICAAGVFISAILSACNATYVYTIQPLCFPFTPLHSESYTYISFIALLFYTTYMSDMRLLEY